MKNIKPWIRFGCFLTGYNFNIIKSSSEASAKEVKKNTSALLIVIILWGTIGYLFSDRYMHLEALGSSIVALAMVVIVVQIERQIILDMSDKKWGGGKVFRIVIGLVMALIGSVIIDQIIFKDDVEIGKEVYLSEKIKTILPSKLQEINNEIQRLDSLIISKKLEEVKLNDEITKKPYIKMPTYETIRKPGKYKTSELNINGNIIEIEKDTIYIEKIYKEESILNPKAARIPDIRNQIDKFSEKRDKFVLKKINIRENLEKELKEKTGFLVELDIMKKIVLESWVSLLFWLLWFLFFCAIELFVLVNKLSKKETDYTDYDVVIKHERDSKIKAIKQLSAQ